MIDFNKPILPAKSIAGINLGTDVQVVLADAYRQGYNIEECNFLTNPIPAMLYKINDSIVSITTTPKGIITSLHCSIPYTGALNDKFTPGMTVGQIAKLSTKQRFLHDTIMVDGEYGAGYIVPYGFENLDYFNQLSSDLKLTEMFVYPRNWIPGSA